MKSSGGATRDGSAERGWALIAVLNVSFWLSAIGLVVLYVFFLVLASISPAQVTGLTAVMVPLGTIVTLRNTRVGRELADPGGDPHLRRRRNGLRERRGF